MEVKQIFMLLNFLMVFHVSTGLKCYTCSIGENDADTTCVTDPAKVDGSAITNCDKKYCTIIRQELKDPVGKINSFTRNCEDKPLYIDDIIEDGTYRFYYKACKTDLCNGGNGKEDTDNSKGFLGDKSTIYCPGTGKVA